MTCLVMLILLNKYCCECMALAGTYLSQLQNEFHFRRCLTRGISLDSVVGRRPDDARDSSGSDEMGTVLHLIMES